VLVVVDGSAGSLTGIDAGVVGAVRCASDTVLKPPGGLGVLRKSPLSDSNRDPFLTMEA
jgi:hypothetical protein